VQAFLVVDFCDEAVDTAAGGKDFLRGILDECRAVATAEGYPPRDQGPL
jgi:hypothetical protein